MKAPTAFTVTVSYLLGYAFSTIVGAVIIKLVLDRYYHGYESGRTVENWRTGVVGLVERALYTSAYLLAAPEFIAIWLALKVAGQWERWKLDWSSKDRPAEIVAGRDTARASYSGFLLGNALSIAYGVVGAFIVRAGLASRWGYVALGLLVLPAATGLLFLYIYRNTAAASSQTPRAQAARGATRKRATRAR